MRLVNFSSYAKNNPPGFSVIKRMARTQAGATITSDTDGYVFIDNEKTSRPVFGYVILHSNKIDWIYVKKNKTGVGTKLLRRVENIIKSRGEYNEITLTVSIDPTEAKESVTRRLNFYIKNNYRVRDIRYRKKHGPLLLMFKAI